MGYGFEGRSISRKVLELITERVSDSMFVSDIRANYSGRGMYGKECLGIVIDGDVVRFMAIFAVRVMEYLVLERDCDGDTVSELLVDLIESSRTDSMGMSTIVYFPGYELVND